MQNILYIHGFNSTGKIFNYLINNLPEHNHIVANYNSADTIDSSVISTIKYIKHKSEPLYIIGHSLGGIIAQLVAADPTLNVHGLISISTPFGGHTTISKLRWFYPQIKVFWDLSPQSPHIKNLKKQKPACDFLSIISTGGALPFMSEPNDGVVSVESERASVASKTIDINSNHFEILQDPKTVAIIKKQFFSKNNIRDNLLVVNG